MIYASLPPQSRCKNCGKFWTGIVAPVCQANKEQVTNEPHSGADVTREKKGWESKLLDSAIFQKKLDPAQRQWVILEVRTLIIQERADAEQKERKRINTFHKCTCPTCTGFNISDCLVNLGCNRCNPTHKGTKEDSLEKINRFSTEEIVSSFTDLLTP